MAAAATLGLVVTLAQVPVLSSTANATAVAASSADPIEVAPDATAAAAAAQAQGAPVEDASARTATTSTMVNPDGSSTVEIAQTPVHVRKDGEFVKINPSLTTQDGALVPKASRAAVEISPEGTDTDAPLAQISKGTKTLGLDWAA